MSTIKSAEFIPVDRNAVNGPRDDLADAKNKIDKRDPRMLEAARGFETQFIRQMISEMRKTVPKDELMNEGMADDIYRGQLDDQYAEIWSQQGGTGLADIIYDQLQQRYGKHNDLPTTPGTFMKLPQGHGMAHVAHSTEQIQDLLARADRDLFLAKKVSGGFSLKSREPLPENVDLRSPLSGLVLQAAALPDGKEVVVIKHDEGLVTQLVHSGHNRVKTNMRVAAGQTIAELPASQNGESAHVFFGLREAAKTE